MIPFPPSMETHMSRWSALLVAAAGLMGASGVALAAWAAHRSGGDTLMTAASFLILHAGPVAAIGLATGGARTLAPATALAIGATLFSGDLALRLIANVKPWANAAPTGGVILIIGWLGLAVAGASWAVSSKNARNSNG